MGAKVRVSFSGAGAASFREFSALSHPTELCDIRESTRRMGEGI